jgi:hypothetical protein
MRYLVVLYHLGASLYSDMQKCGVAKEDCDLWLLQWEEVMQRASTAPLLEWSTATYGLLNAVRVTRSLINTAAVRPDGE